jgi:hypothetical protein
MVSSCVSNCIFRRPCAVIECLQRRFVYCFWLDNLGLRFHKLYLVALGMITCFLYLMTVTELDLGFLEKVFIFHLFSYHVCILYSLAKAIGFKT